MTKTVILEKDAVRLRELRKSGRGTTTRKIKKCEVFDHLWRPVELCGATVRSLLDILQSNTHWLVVLQEPFLSSVLEEYHLLRKDDAPRKGQRIDTVMVRVHGESSRYADRIVDVIPLKKGDMILRTRPAENPKTHFEFKLSFTVDGEYRGESFGVDLLPLREYIDAKVVFDPDFELHSTNYVDLKRKTSVKSLGKYRITVLELFKALSWEMTFFGTVSNRQEFRDSLSKSARQSTKKLGSLIFE